MRILHVASFSGNVGDNANHNGMRKKLAEVLPPKTGWDELEIRKFYRNYDGADKLRFDEAFAERANAYDLVVIGGGNFFEIWIEDSSTGCTIDLDPGILGKIRTSILFFGLGFDTYKGYSESTRLKFLRFLEATLASDRILVTVRNDGSMEQLERCYGKAVANKVLKVPDGGFFVHVGDEDSPLIAKDARNIALCLAQDMPSVRYGKDREARGKKHLVISTAEYVKRIAAARDETRFILMPHIYSDLQIISELLEAIPDFLRRNRVVVGPCLIGQGAERHVFRAYAQTDCVVSMRFHANVCPIGLGVPTIGLSSYKKIQDLYRELRIEERLVEAKDSSLGNRLFEKTIDILDDPVRFAAENGRVLNDLTAQMAEFLRRFSSFLDCAKASPGEK